MCHCSGLSSTSSGRNIGNGSAVPCILNLGTTWRWLNIFMSHGETARCPLYRRDFTVSTLQERLHGVHSTGETSRCPLYRRDFTVSNVQERLHGVHSTGETSRCPLYRRDFTVSTVQERLHGVHFTGETSRCSLYRRDFTVSTVQERLHGVHCTGETSRWLPPKHCTLRTEFEDDDWTRLAQALMKNTGGDFLSSWMTSCPQKVLCSVGLCKFWYNWHNVLVQVAKENHLKHPWRRQWWRCYLHYHLQYFSGA